LSGEGEEENISSGCQADTLNQKEDGKKALFDQLGRNGIMSFCAEKGREKKAIGRHSCQQLRKGKKKDRPDSQYAPRGKKGNSH